MHNNSRKDRISEFLDQFVKGDVLTISKPIMSLYPKEIDYFKKYYPSLSFKIMDTIQTDSGMKYTVQVSKK